MDLTNAPKTRLLSVCHAYSAMFKTRLGPIIDQNWANSVISERLTEEEKAKPIPAVPINFRNTALKRMLADEPQEIHDEVETWRQAQRNKDVKEQGDDNEETCRLAVANQYHK